MQTTSSVTIRWIWNDGGHQGQEIRNIQRRHRIPIQSKSYLIIRKQLQDNGRNFVWSTDSKAISAQESSQHVEASFLEVNPFIPLLPILNADLEWWKLKWLWLFCVCCFVLIFIVHCLHWQWWLTYPWLAVCACSGSWLAICGNFVLAVACCLLRAISSCACCGLLLASFCAGFCPWLAFVLAVACPCLACSWLWVSNLISDWFNFYWAPAFP